MSEEDEKADDGGSNEEKRSAGVYCSTSAKYLRAVSKGYRAVI